MNCVRLWDSNYTVCLFSRTTNKCLLSEKLTAIILGDGDIGNGYINVLCIA